MRSVTKYRIFGAAALSGLIALAPAVMAQDVGRGIQLVQYYDHDSGMAAKAAGEERGAEAKAAGEERGAAAKAAGERHGDEAKYAGMRESEEAKEAGIRHSEAAKADSDYRAEHPYGYHHDHHHKPRPPYGY